MTFDGAAGPWPGQPYPLGATLNSQGVNFALYSEHATAVELCLYRKAEDAEPSHRLWLSDRTGPVYHGLVPGLKAGWHYGYRVHGEYAPEKGLRFNPQKLLLDPYARAVGRPMRMHPSLFGYDADAMTGGLDWPNDADSGPYAPLATVVDDAFDWGGDRRLEHAYEDTVIYEAHVRGLTMRHPDVPEELRGTYLGLASDALIEHLVSLGVSAVQLLPVHAIATESHLQEKGLTNYWGYNTLAYFAPEPKYARGGPIAAVSEFKSLVRRLHAAGLEVIIDVVFNHTGEGSHLGPTISFRGIDNASYYKLQPTNLGRYIDYTGTGNTFDPGNPFVLQLIMDSLRYWVEEMHVDGFRFDLASALARELYDVDMLSAFFKVIQQDPLLSRVKLIAEPWDVGHGGYQVGNFPWHWSEWNGRYRDTVRGYWRGDDDRASELATRISGSSDLFVPGRRRPFASINFVTAHDGFTLADLVSYEHKHNLANGEEGRDGESMNLSSNLGVEGPTDDPLILARREVRRRSLFLTLLLSQGVPMLLGGDEIGRSQGGNNNAYCQDNEISWFDWDLDERDQGFLDFVRRVVRFRQAHPVFRRKTFLTGALDASGCKDVAWLHPDGHELAAQEWEGLPASAFGMMLCGAALHERDPFGRARVDGSYLLLFHGRGGVPFRLPAPPAGEVAWVPCLTSLPTMPTAATGGPLRMAEGTVVDLEADGLTVYAAVNADGSDGTAADGG